MEMTCDGCGFTNPTGHRFCGGCGSKLDAPLASVLAERRHVSVVFVDLVGFTPFSEGRDSEEVRAMLAGYFELARTVIARHGGVVDKLMGDGVMAVWGARTVREDDAERAVLAALELLQGVALMGGAFTARAGVNSGEAAVDMNGQDAGMVIGDLVNTAARLERAATPGTVLVGVGTFRAAGSRIEFDHAGMRELKGKSAPVPTWVARGPRNRDASGIQSPFLGRESELLQLMELAQSSGRGARLMTVVGAAGVGKTRLAKEFCRLMGSHASVVYGRSPVAAPGTTLVALAEMIRSLAKVDESADEDSTRSQVEGLLAESVQDAAEREWIEPAVLRLLGVSTIVVAGTDLFSRWRLLLERLSQQRPLVLVFDDVQAADETTLAFIDHLLEWVREDWLLIVAVARPELRARRANWCTDTPPTTHAELGPLPSTVMLDIVGALVPDLPADVAAVVVQRCEGIPLYALEIVRMLAAEQRIIRSGREYELRVDLGEVQIPESLTGLIAARLDTLAPTVRRLALQASVLGDRFAGTTLGAVCGVEPDTLSSTLDALIAAGILVEDTDVGDDRSFYFTQGLVREIAYNTLSRVDRRALHASVARHLESGREGDLVGLIASHDLAAFKCAPDAVDADMFALRAVTSLQSAIERAWLLGAFGQVVALADDALVLTASHVERAAVLERRASAAIEVGDYADALVGLEEALDFHDGSGDADASARVASVIGETLLRLARTNAARAVLDRAIAQYADRVHPVRLGMLQVQAARALDFEGQSQQGFLLAQHVVDVATDNDAIGLKADALVAQGTCCGRLGRIDDGVEYLTEGIQLADASGQLGTLLRGKTNLAWILMHHDARRAHALTVDGCSFARRVGATSMERFMLSFRAGLAHQLGDWQDADTALDMVAWDSWEGSDVGQMLTTAILISASRGLNTSTLHRRLTALEANVAPSFYASWLGEADVAIHTANGRLGEAESSAWSSARAADTLDPTEWLRAARCSLWVGRPRRAAQALQRFDDMVNGAHTTLLERDALAGSVGLALGRVGSHVGAVLRARQELLDLGLGWPAALIAIDAAIAVGAGHPSVTTELDQARAFFVETNCAPYVAIIDGLTSA